MRKIIRANPLASEIPLAYQHIKIWLKKSTIQHRIGEAEPCQRERYIAKYDSRIQLTFPTSAQNKRFFCSWLDSLLDLGSKRKYSWWYGIGTTISENDIKSMLTCLLALTRNLAALHLTITMPYLWLHLKDKLSLISHVQGLQSLGEWDKWCIYYSDCLWCTGYRKFTCWNEWVILSQCRE